MGHAQMLSSCRKTFMLTLLHMGLYVPLSANGISSMQQCSLTSPGGQVPLDASSTTATSSSTIPESQQVDARTSHTHSSKLGPFPTGQTGAFPAGSGQGRPAGTSVSDRYKMGHGRRGVCLLFNNVEFKSDLAVRSGSDCDAANLQRIFDALGFSVLPLRNSTVDQMKRKTREGIARSSHLVISISTIQQYITFRVHVFCCCNSFL